VGNLGERTIELSNQTGNEAIINHPLFLEVKSKFQEYDTVVIKRTFSGMGTNVITADLYRGRIDNSIHKIISGMAAIKGLDQSEDAQHLLDIYAETGDIRGKSYADESVIHKKRIEKFNLPENKERIARLGLTQQVNLYVETVTGFDALFLDQAQANSSLRQLSTATATRQYLEEALRNYFGFVTAMRHIAPYDALYASLSEVVKAARLSKRAGGEEETTPPVV